MIERLVIVGVGLIGGSLARALRTAGAVREIVGCGRGLANLQRAAELGVVDRVETNIGHAVRDADVVVLAVPVGSTAEVLTGIAPYLADSTVVTDVGSVKGSVVAAARDVLGAHLPAFVPAHPIAGTERSGVEASFSGLFQQRRVVVTPIAETDRRALDVVCAMWRAAGAEIVTMDVAHHDEILAATSHLPHLLAYSLVDTLARLDDSREIFDFAAGGFRDFTRIASSDPVMWRDICLANRDALSRMLRRYRRDLDGLLRAIESGDSERLLKMFADAKRARDTFSRNRSVDGHE